jgi:hypothetical protein
VTLREARVGVGEIALLAAIVKRIEGKGRKESAKGAGQEGEIRANPVSLVAVIVGIHFLFYFVTIYLLFFIIIIYIFLYLCFFG